MKNSEARKYPDHIKNLVFPGVLVVKEKHCTRYMKAGTVEELYVSALKLVNERIDPDYQWYYKPDKPDTENVLSEEQIKALPEGRVKDLAVKEFKNVKYDFAQYEDDLAFWNAVQECIKKSDGKLAYALLMNHRDYEYESIEFVNLE